MRPVLFTVGSFPVRAYGVFLLLGIGVGFLALRQGWKGCGLRPGSIYGFCAGAILSGLVGGRLGFLMLHALDTMPEPERWLRFWQQGGEAAWGAMGACFVWSWVYGRRTAVSTAAFFDLLAPPAALAEGVMRWGCLLNGCCYGRKATAFPGVVLPDVEGEWALRYPTQVFYSAVSFGLFALLWGGRERKPFAGFLALMYVVLYAAGRLVIGLLRGDYVTPESRMVSLGLDLLLLSVGIGALVRQVRRSRRSRESAL